jgi:hypothetical protein
MGSQLDPAGEDEAERLRKKRQTIFKSKYEVDERIISRNKALVNLVKVACASHAVHARLSLSLSLSRALSPFSLSLSPPPPPPLSRWPSCCLGRSSPVCAARRLTRAARRRVLTQSLGRTNLRQAEEIASLKDKVSALEDQLVRLQPLEALLAYMQQSSDNTVLALLAADGGAPPPTAGAPTLPPSEVLDRLVMLLQTCGEGVDDLGPEILQSEAQACDMAAAGDEGWVDAIASAERQHQGEQEQADEKPHGGRRGRRPRAAGDDQDGQNADEWMGFGDGEDAFEAEIAAVGTHLHQVCHNCGESYTDTHNSDWACRFHPGVKKVDAAWNSVWTCCGLKHAMKGCKVTRHVPSLADDAEPDDDSERS